MSDFNNTNRNNLAVEALFLGPRSENRAFFRESLRSVVDEHCHWRRNFHPDDAPLVNRVSMENESFRKTEARSVDILDELTARLKKTSTPWFSTRYLGHMNSDTLMISNLAEMATILYNPNNVAYESSVATSEMEAEVGADLCKLFGYDTNKAWGHITADGTIANYEGLWLARNLKSLPRAIKATCPDLVSGKSNWELCNLRREEALDLLGQLRNDRDTYKQVLTATARGQGMADGVGRVFVPGTRHYSWDKACDLLGIGIDNLVHVPLADNFRMDLGELRKQLETCLEQEIPVIAVVGVVGTTEEGQVDDVQGLLDLREEFRTRGLDFYLHVDAAYGGYGRSLFLDEDGRYMEFEELRARLQKDGLAVDGEWPSEHTWRSYRACSEADSVTIDPHKMGYVPYAAGGVIFRDRRILGLISYTAAYVFEDADAGDLVSSLGSVTLEGSKPGASVAGVWAAHKLLPLNYSGYGQVIARSWGGARKFSHILETLDGIEVAGATIQCQPLLLDPDFNMICMAFNVLGNHDLDAMNELNQEIYYNCSYQYKPLYENDWITSHTMLDREVYGDSPQGFIEKFGISGAEWEKAEGVTVLRASVMHPWLLESKEYPQVVDNFRCIMQRKLETVVPKWLERHSQK